LVFGLGGDSIIGAGASSTCDDSTITGWSSGFADSSVILFTTSGFGDSFGTSEVLELTTGFGFAELELITTKVALTSADDELDEDSIIAIDDSELDWLELSTDELDEEAIVTILEANSTPLVLLEFTSW
jgi:hypothetical protein